MGGKWLELLSEIALPCSSHAVVVERASASVERLDSSLDQAQDSGDLKFFNREFQKRRIAAKLRGESYPNYGIFRSKLKRVLASHAAGKPTSTILSEVFGE